MKYKVLHVIDTGGPGGAETVLKNIVQDLPGDKFISKVIVPGEGWLYNNLKDLELDVAIIPRHRSPDLPFLLALIEQIRNFNPDIIHCHLLTSSVYASVATSFFRQLPLIVTFHGLPDIKGNKIALYLKGIILSRKKNRLVFVANHLRKTISLELNLPDSICHTIHNGIPFREINTNKSVIDQINPDRKIIIGSVGNIRPAKDYPTLLDAAKIVCKTFPQVKFLIAGQGSESNLNLLKSIRDKAGLKNNVEFNGFVADVREFISKLDIFLSCSITEGLPLAVLEAAGNSCPIVATDCGGNLEILSENTSIKNYLAPIKNPEEIAKQIISMINNLALAQQDANKLTYEIRERFNIPAMVNQYIDMYQQTIENS